MKNRVSRRGFLKTGALAAAAACAPNIVTSFSLFGADGQPGPNDRINFGIIGMGKRGNTWMIPQYLKNFPALRLVAMCDVDALKLDFAKKRADAVIAEKAAGEGSYTYSMYKDFRDLLARPDIDFVDISTPDHWHVPMTLHAFKAGKDVVCTKPPFNGVAEGRAVVEYWKKTGRVFTSTQILQAGVGLKKWVRSGCLGKIKEVHISRWPCSFGGPPLGGGDPVPEGLDWDMWCGPAELLPYNKRYHNHCDPATAGFNPWRDIRPFGMGHLSDFGGHYLGAAMWACDLHTTAPVEVTFYPHRRQPSWGDDGPQNDEPTVEWVFANGIRILAKHFAKSVASGNILVIGEEGDTSYEGIKKLDPAKARAIEVLDYKEQWDHAPDIVYSVRARNRHTLRNPDVCQAIHSAVCLADISYRLGGRTIKFDPVKEQIIGDAEANTLLTRTYRDPWGLNV